MDNKLDEEIKNGKFIIFLQPKFDILTQSVVGAEALVRKQENGKVILPDNFIPFYEKTGEIIKLDMYVLEEVFKLQNKWKKQNVRLLPISINESRHHLKNVNHIKELKELIKKYNVDTNLIELEMTETTIIEDIEVAKNAEKEAHKLGFRISMDDFGTGYSAFNVLKDIEIDILKIDKVFFEGLEQNERAQIIIDTIVQMCKRLNVKTVAEGIEDKWQLDFLKKIRCDIVQGYYFSKPISISDFEKRYNQESSTKH